MSSKSETHIYKNKIDYKKKNGRYTFEDALEIFNLGNAQLQGNNFINYNTKMKFICECGEADSKSLRNFTLSPYCTSCANLKRRKSKSTPFYLVKKEFDTKGYKLITNDYINAFQKLEYICNCGEKLTTTYERIRNGNIPFGCKCVERKKYTKEYLNDLLRDNNLSYLGHYQKESTYTYVIKFICSCGIKSEKNLSNLMDTWICNECSHKNFIAKISGENSYQWNINKTEEDRLDDRKYTEYKSWRKLVFERDNYTCQCCDAYGTTLNAHHKNGYNWCIEERVDVKNGVTLCVECHSEFHNLYGRGNNTEAQYHQFIKNRNSLHEKKGSDLK